MKKIIVLFLAFIMIFVFAGCNDGGKAAPPEVITGEEVVKLELSEYEINTVCGRRIDLPVPSFVGGGSEISADGVTVEILSSDGKVFVPSYNYHALTTFRPNTAGTFYVVYTAAYGGREYSETAKIYVSDPENGSDIVVDGVLNDAKYSEIPTYRTGIEGKMSVKLAFEKNGFYLGVEVLDDNLIYNTYVSKKFLQSDGFEVCLDLGGKFQPMLNDKCVKIQMNVNGVLWISKAGSGLALYELDERLANHSMYKIQYIGTRTDVDGEDFKTYTDTDIGYVLELYMPYELLGFSDIADVIGITCSHRDISSNITNEYQVGGSGNQYFQEAELPESFVEENNQNTSYEFEHMQGSSMTSLYNKCYLTGIKGVAQSQNVCDIDVDGERSEEAWESASALKIDAVSAENGSALLTAEAFATVNGLYLFAEVSDKTLSTNKRADIFSNDCVQFNIASSDDIYSATLPAGCDIKSRSLTISVSGQSRSAYLNNKGNEFVGGFDFVKAVKITESGYNVEVFIPAYEINLDVSEFCGICVGLINCDGAATAESDMVFSCDRNSPNVYEIVLKG